MKQAPVVHLVALAAVLAIAVSAASPAFAGLATRQACAPPADGCPRSTVLGFCCCGHGSPATPAGQQVQQTPAAAARALAPESARPGAARCRTFLAAAPRHGHLFIDLTTLHSRYLL